MHATPKLLSFMEDPEPRICSVGSCLAQLSCSQPSGVFREMCDKCASPMRPEKRKRVDDENLVEQPELEQPEPQLQAVRKDCTEAAGVTVQEDASTSAAELITGQMVPEAPITVDSARCSKVDGAPPGKTRMKQCIATTTSQEVFRDIRDNFKNSPSVNFTASYEIPEDPLITDRNRVQMTVHEIWKVTGYRFTVKDHPQIKAGHKTRLKCSQDQTKKRGARKQQDSITALYNCRSALTVSCIMPNDNPRRRLITIRLHHHEKHKPYVAESVYGIPLLPNFDKPDDESADEDDAHSDKHDIVTDQLIEKAPRGRIGKGRTFEERFKDHIQTLRDFCDGLEYQVQFNDPRMLETLEREGGSFLRFAKDCLTQERAAWAASDGPSSAPEEPATHSPYFPINHMPPPPS